MYKFISIWVGLVLSVAIFSEVQVNSAYSEPIGDNSFKRIATIIKRAKVVNIQGQIVGKSSDNTRLHTIKLDAAISNEKVIGEIGDFIENSRLVYDDQITSKLQSGDKHTSLNSIAVTVGSDTLFTTVGANLIVFGNNHAYKGDSSNDLSNQLAELIRGNQPD